MLPSSSVELFPTPSVPPSPGMLPELSTLDIRLFQYYVEKLSSRLANADGLWNPLRVLVIPRMCSSIVLFHAACAGSALHMARFSSEDVERYDRLARLHYVQALSALKNLIPTLNQAQAATDKSMLNLDEIALLASIFLCKYEIIKDGMSIWRHHLDGVETLYTFLASKYRGSRHDTIEFAHNFLTYHKSIASLTTEVTEDSDEAWEEAPAPSSNEMSSIDLYMGCSRSLFVLLLRVMRLRKLCDRVCSRYSHVKSEVESILVVLSRQQWRLEHFNIPEDMTFGTAEGLQHVAQAFESCLLVCLHSIIEDSAQSSRDADPGSYWEEISHMLPTSKQEALQACIREIDLVPMDGSVEAGLLPLLFVVACESHDFDESLAAIQRVDRLGSNIGIGNQCYAGVLVREIWTHRLQHHEGSWRDFLKTSDWKNIILT
ncbi:hypothetical protein FALBO_14823 [Fusarium albosuccineum]|uniref:Uncharacterized protein n=1 Tax=Fusarium albosuccineum TaxID=1237068 RepID=A0A8H4KZU3_9HYPO|nr:hypothetical protein FALBO_14823 [Fusarium albosuccineum]